MLVLLEQITFFTISDTNFTTRWGRILDGRRANLIHTLKVGDIFILPGSSGGVWVRIIIWTLRLCHACVILIGCTPVLFGELWLNPLVRLHEPLLAFKLSDAVLERLYCLLTLINLFLVVSLARVKKCVLEELNHSMQLFIHSVECAVDVQFESRWLTFNVLHCLRRLLV